MKGCYSSQHNLEVRPLLLGYEAGFRIVRNTSLTLCQYQYQHDDASVPSPHVFTPFLEEIVQCGSLEGFSAALTGATSLMLSEFDRLRQLDLLAFNAENQWNWADTASRSGPLSCGQTKMSLTPGRE